MARAIAVVAVVLVGLLAVACDDETTTGTESATATESSEFEEPRSIDAPTAPTETPPAGAVGTACPGAPTLPSNESPLFAYAAPDKTIWIVSADGTNATQLICNSTGSRNVSWSPSGKYLAYVDGNASLRMLNVETGEDTLVDDGSQGSLLFGPSAALALTSFSWSPTSDTLLYQKYDGPDLRTSLGRWMVTFGGTPFPVVRSASARNVTLSPDGRRLVYTLPSEVTPMLGAGRTAQVFLMNVDGTGNHKLADGVSASWSPDGRLLAYWTEDRGGSSFSGDIVIMEVDTGRSVSLGEFTSDESPAWSPDPSRNVFHNLVIDVTAQTATPLFDRPSVILGWSPDGMKVAYVEGPASGPGPRSLVVLDTHNGQQDTLHTSNAYTPHVLGSGYRGVWSPDGRYYAYSAVESADEAGVMVLYVTDTESGATNRLWEGTVLDSISTAYSPDGSKLLVEIDANQSPSVWLADADGTALTVVANGQALRSSIRLPAWRPAIP